MGRDGGKEGRPAGDLELKFKGCCCVLKCRGRIEEAGINETGVKAGILFNVTRTLKSRRSRGDACTEAKFHREPPRSASSGVWGRR